MRSIAILDCQEIECPPVLVIVYRELCTAFENVRICNRISELTNNDIVFMGDFFHCEDPERLLYEQAPDAIYLGWYWHEKDIRLLKNFIYIYENALVPDDRVRKVAHRIHCPLPLRASEHPDKVGTYKKMNVWDYCYIGPWAYNRELRPSRFRGFVHDNYGVENFLDYETRKHAYLMSTCALAFQSDWNSQMKHVSQRVYEALAYGCVVLSNSPAAVEQTDGIVVLVTSKEDVESKIEYYLAHPEEVEQKRQAAYEFTKRCGTNHFTKAMLMDKIAKFI